MSRRIEPADYIHLIIACLLHDIGYVRGVLSGDTKDEFVTGDDGRRLDCLVARQMLRLPLTMSTVELFAIERLGNPPEIDVSELRKN